MKNKSSTRYNEDTGANFGAERPLDFLVEATSDLSSGKALDIGAGDGRNSLYLAKRGFEVRAVDLSKNAIHKLSERAVREHLSIHTVVGDILEIGLEGSYEVIVCSAMLHHLARERALQLIERMQQHTAADGLHVAAVVNKGGDFFKSNPNTGRFYPEVGEMFELYRRWVFIKYEERKFTAMQKWPDGSDMINVAAQFIVRKPS